MQVATRIILPLGSETVVKPVTGVTGEKLRSSRDKFYQKRQVAMNNGIIKMQTHLSFLVKVANFSDEPVDWKKNQLLGAANSAPGSVLSVLTHEEPMEFREILCDCPDDVNIVKQQGAPVCEDQDAVRPG